MREILFRGKRTDNGEWVYGSYVEAKNSWHKFGLHKDWIIPMAFANGGWFAIAERFPVVGDTVGQYTGLNDKNGDKIFEGDILRDGEKNLLVWWNCEAFQWQAKEQRFYDPIFTFDGTAGAVWDNIDFGWIAAEIPCTGKMTTEIIGNIFDNPKLLK